MAKSELTMTTTRGLRLLTLDRNSPADNFGFTLRHVEVFPPDSWNGGSDAAQDPTLAVSAAGIGTIVVSCVQPNSPAFFAGLTEGQRILMINDSAVGHLSYEDILHKLQTSGKSLSILVSSGLSDFNEIDEGHIGTTSDSTSSSTSELNGLSDGQHSSLRTLTPPPTDSLGANESLSTTTDSPSPQFVWHSRMNQNCRVEELMKELKVRPPPPPYLRTAYSNENVYWRGPTPPPYQHVVGTRLSSGCGTPPNATNNPTFAAAPPHLSQPQTPSGLTPMRFYSTTDLPTAQSQWEPRRPTFHFPKVTVTPPNGGRGLVYGLTPLGVISDIREDLEESRCETPPARHNDFLHQLPDIRENSELKSPQFYRHEVPIVTGVVSQIVRSASATSDFSALTDKRLAVPKENDLLAQLQLVSKKVDQWESGQTDTVGALKLYHAQAYKRELAKICAQNYGSVMRKAACFDSTSTSPRLSVGSDSTDLLNWSLPLVSPTEVKMESAWLLRSAPDVSSGSGEGNRKTTRHPSFLAAVTGGRGEALLSHDNAQLNFNRRSSYDMAASGMSITPPSAESRRNTTEPTDRPSVISEAKEMDVSSAGNDVAVAIPYRRVNGLRTTPVSKGSPEKRFSTPNLSPCQLAPSTSKSLSTTEEATLCGTEETSRQSGHLWHKQTYIGQGKRAPDRGWKECWAVLDRNDLCLCKDRPDPEDVFPPSEEQIWCHVDVAFCITDIAYDYTKRKNVFRVLTQSQNEHLFQAASREEMLRWLSLLQRAVNGETQNDGVANSKSLALIIKHYEAHNQSLSPSLKSRKSKFLKVSSKVESDSESPSLRPSKSDTKGSDKAAVPAESGKSRKWRKVRKSGSCPTPSQRGQPEGPEDSMFGMELEECPTSSDNDFVPLLIQLCVKVIEAHGIEAVGVYRIPGNTAAVNTLMGSLNKGFENVDFNDARWRDVNVVSSLLKAFFRKLPDPLLTNRLYSQFIDANRIDSHLPRLKRIKQLIGKLPKANYETLKYLMSHLGRIVSHSHVNRMEARNLALMFGPSLVRPAGDSMTTMVTHMSDQCKLVETLILYCDFLFSSDPDKPVPPQNLADTGQLHSSSFSDMTDLLRRVSKTEDELQKTKENILQSILSVKSTKKDKTTEAKANAKRNTSKEPGRPRQQPVYAGHSRTIEIVENLANRVSSSNSHDITQERNIDEEIERRKTSETPLVTEPPLFTSSPIGRESAVDNQTTCDLAEVADEMRRRREEKIYTARRIFIAGQDANELVKSASAINTVGGGISVGSGLNLASSSEGKLVGGGGNSSSYGSKRPGATLSLTAQSFVDVLSPETREKLRQFQLDSQLLHYKSQWQTEKVRQASSQREKIERQLDRAKKDLEGRDFLDKLADNPRKLMSRSFVESETDDTTDVYSSAELLDLSSSAASLSAAERNSRGPSATRTDTASVTSDYSTTSSNVGGTKVGSVLHVPTASSDYSSQGSPATPYVTKLALDGGTPVAGSLESPYDRSRLKRLSPETSFIRNTSSVANYVNVADVNQIPVGRHGNVHVATSPQQFYRVERPWYEVAEKRKESGESRPTISPPQVDQNFNHVDANSSEERTTVVSPSRNKSSASVKRVASENCHQSSPVGDEDKMSGRGGDQAKISSRIGQKIKFRGRQDLSEKRKDPRRHTLSDIDQIRNFLFGPKDAAEPLPPPAVCESARDESGAERRLTPVKRDRSASRTGRFKAWIKDSFRANKAELSDDDNNDPRLDSPPVTGADRLPS